jgi:hypothetical protein
MKNTNNLDVLEEYTTSIFQVYISISCITQNTTTYSYHESFEGGF